MKYKNTRSLRLAPRAAGFALATLLPLAVGSASAFELNLGAVTGSLDTTVSYGSTWRMEAPDDKLSTNYPNYFAAVAANRRTFVNKSEGDANFDNDSRPVSSVFKLTSEMELKYDNFGAFVRGSMFYDTVLMDEEPNRPHGNLYPNAGSCNVQNSPGVVCGFPSELDDHSGNKARVLDAYVYGNFDVGSFPLNVRLGEQVVSWGEALFLQDGINSANPVSLSQLRLPGAEVKEALLPLPMLYGSLGIGDNATIEAFYQFDWDYSEADDVGTFYSTDDAFAGLGANNILVWTFNPLSPTLSAAGQGAILNTLNGNNSLWLSNKRLADKEVDSKDQFGLAFRYSMENTEFGVFYMNYDSHKQVAQAMTGEANAYSNALSPNNAKVQAAVTNCTAAGGAAATCIATANAFNYINTTTYQFVYPENINLFGLSFSTTLGSLSVAGELAYRPNDVILAELGDNLVVYNTLAAASIGNGFTSSAGNILNNGQPFGARTMVKDWVELETYNVDFTIVNNFGPILGADNAIGVLELGGNYIPEGEDQKYASSAALLNIPRSEVALSAQGSCAAVVYDPASCLSDGASNDYLDRFSWGYRAVFSATYNDAFAGIALTPSIRFAHDVDGNSHRTGNFLENRKSTTLAVSALYNQALEFTVGYNAFWGAEETNLLHDRDNLSANVKYSF